MITNLLWRNINKEINEKTNLCTRTVINPVNETLSEKEKAKKGK